VASVFNLSLHKGRIPLTLNAVNEVPPHFIARGGAASAELSRPRHADLGEHAKRAGGLDVRDVLLRAQEHRARKAQRAVRCGGHGGEVPIGVVQLA
jgi:hypothetical protein